MKDIPAAVPGGITSMPMARAGEITLSLVGMLALVGCGSVGRLDPSPSHPVDLSGSWTMDHAASDNPQPLLDKLRPRPQKNPYGLPADDGTGLGPDQGPDNGGPQGGQGGGGRGRRGQQQMPNYRNNNDAFTHTQVIKALRADLARADNVTVQQSPDRMALDYGSMIRTFTPGTVSVVGADWGVADQSAGWKGKDFLIEVKPQAGVGDHEKWTLSDDGKRLTEQLKLGGGEFPAVELKRVYVHTDKPLPRAGLPSND